MKVKIVLGILAVLWVLSAVAYSLGFLGQNEPPSNQSAPKEEQNILTGKLGEVEQANAATITLKISQLCCINEANAIAGALKKLGAAGEIKVDLDKKLVSLVYDKKKINESAIIKALKDAGFSSEIVKE